MAAPSSDGLEVASSRGETPKAREAGLHRQASSFFQRGRPLTVRRLALPQVLLLPAERSAADPTSLAPIAKAQDGRAYVFEDPALAQAFAHRGHLIPGFQRPGSDEVHFPTGRVWVRLPSDLPNHERGPWLASLGLRETQPLALPSWALVEPVEGSFDPVDLARDLVASGKVLEAEPSVFVRVRLHGLSPTRPNDPYFDDSWTLHNGGAGPSRDGKGNVQGADHAHVAEAWELLRRLEGTSVQDVGARVRLGIIDDGFDLRHEDLGSKFVDSLNLGGPVEPNTLFSAQSGHRDFHGTLVAGIAAAVTNNGLGVAGACPGCKLVGVRMDHDPTATGLTPDHYFDQVFGEMFQRNPDILNCSWGPDDSLPSAFFQAWMDRFTTQGRHGRGTVVVVASGNAGADFSWNSMATHPRVISVGATDSKGRRHGFSNYGDALTLMAPTGGGEKQSAGVGSRYVDRIWSTDNYLAPPCLSAGQSAGSGCSDSAGWNPSSPMAGGDGWNGKYSFRFSHTSAAAPLVSGIVGLLLHVHESFTVDEIRSLLTTTADPVSREDARYDEKGHSSRYGYGRVNALRAVAAAWEAKRGPLSPELKQAVDEASPCQGGTCWGKSASPPASKAPPNDTAPSSSPGNDTAPPDPQETTATPEDTVSAPVQDEPEVPGAPERRGPTPSSLRPIGTTAQGCQTAPAVGLARSSSGALLALLPIALSWARRFRRRPRSRG